MAQRIPLRGFFKISARPNTFEEARNIYSYFASKGELLEFRFARDPDVKRIKDYGWISYKDSKITEQLFENWFKIEPYNMEVLLHRSVQKGPSKGRPIKMFGGFYLKDNGKTTSSSKLDQTNDNFTLTSSSILGQSEHNSTLLSENNQRGENMTIEEVIEETIEATKNEKGSTNYTENTIIENTAATIP